ncbi:MAG: FtsX-like permease family protein [Acidobacteriota bacterium]
MLMHVFKLIWNRKRANALIIAELALAFLVVFFIAAVGAHFLHRWNQPLGFEWRNTLEILPSKALVGQSWSEEDGRRARALVSTLEDQPEVEWVHHSFPPFRQWAWRTSVGLDERQVGVNVNWMSDGAPEDFGVELLEGRFFAETDATPDRIPVLIDQQVAAAIFPRGFEPGRDIRLRDDSEERPSWIAVGVFRAFRQQGELGAVRPYLIARFPKEDLTQGISTLQVRLKAGTPVSFEEKLQELVGAEADTWSVTVTPLERLRADRIREMVLPLMVAFWIAAFLLLMVAFGLFGVLWQSVTRRTDELGLRRALGAPKGRIYHLIVVETLAIAVFASLVACVVAIQFPVTGAFPALDWRASLTGMGLGLVTLLALAGICSLYPAWLASRPSPAEALHYE